MLYGFVLRLPLTQVKYVNKKKPTILIEFNETAPVQCTLYSAYSTQNTIQSAF